MIIGHFNTFPYGGAATAARRLHRQLRTSHIDSRFHYHLCDRQQPADASFQQIRFSEPRSSPLLGIVGREIHKRRQRKIHQQFDKHLKDRDPAAEVFAMAQLPQPTRFDWSTIDADVVHLHWISFLADYPSFFGSIPDDVPIVWTLHDMNPFTGGCHYSSGCKSFETGCGDCPQIVSPGPNDVSSDSYRVKRKVLARKNLHVVTPSHWLGELARKSKVWPPQTTFHVIKLGFDLKQFSPLDKQQARERLGIHSEAVLLCFGAEDIRNQRKGFQHLINCLPQVRSEHNIECLVFGTGKIPDTAGLPRMHHFGYVDSVDQQALIYAAADLVIVPSREDNQPQIGLEAMACGTPVVGFNAGGIAEFVREGITGRLAQLGNESQLAEKISKLVNDRDARKHMSTRARMMMQDEFDLAKQSELYITLYRNALSVSDRRSA